MTKEFVLFELAVKLKQIGFDEPCLDFYDDNQELFYNHENKEKIHIGDSVKAPLFQQAFRWFREKYDLHSLIGIYPNTKEWYSSYQDLNWSGKETLDFNKTEDRSIRFKTYEEAELACLHKLIELVELKKRKMI
jgi:hypothetical protein